MTLKRKILIGYGFSVALMALAVAWSVVNLISLGQATNEILRENYRSILAAENMVGALERQDSGILLLFLGDMKKGISQFRENEAVFLLWLARAKDNVTIEGEAELIQSVESSYAKYRREFSEMTELSGGDAPMPLSPIKVYQEVIYPLFSEVRDACVRLCQLNEETMYSASGRAGRVAKSAIWSTVLVASMALIAALSFSLVLAGRIVRPLKGFMEASRKISAGDYSVQVPVNTRDELGNLAGEFNRMASQLDHYHRMNIDKIISEKNKGEAILSSIEDGLIVFDPDLKVTGMNPAAVRMLGLVSREALSLSCSDILPHEHVCDLIGKTVETGEKLTVPDEHRIITLQQGRESRHLLFSVTIIRGSERNLSGIVLLLRDVTRLKEVERLKSEFVMAASHELRTPLTSLGMSVDLLLESFAQHASEQDQELLRAAHEEVERMKALVNDLLDLSKIETGRIDLDIESVPVGTLFDHVLNVFKSQTDIKQVQLTANAPEDLPSVKADANKITWVLSNLISNALRYVNKGGHIQLIGRKIGTYVHLSVRDNGPGIPPEYHSRIFEKFVQVEGQEAGGTGLGLAICKEIVRAHGGTIWVESFPDQGTTFTFTIPVAR